ncbi:TetR/AcrR family transcriptional regulator [Dongia soli]|uniref:TetR/AcrR family transcriptional regulator n=1 Tax=Dongia soli TaxID=600628 RepID=A0ABU5E9B3_9PROT|nr:TetR/AcrR family transcriptional regulator [Dongia soli]MDY0882788.1 TetR/AcrR family transcriptional regulator [Dongia soli]
MASSSSAEVGRSETRRQQVLEAALACFRQHGFHGASMSEISKTAGMSVGHIYHYFENKEAIIGAIVEQDISDIATIFEEISREDDILTAMMARADHGVECHTDPDAAALFHEIMAEAARNPKVAAIVRRADEIKRQAIMDLMRKGRAARGLPISTEDLDGRMEILAAIFEGLSARIIRNPAMNRPATLLVLKGLMERLLKE